MNKYNPKEIEKKWQAIWSKEKAFEGLDSFDRKKYYVLVEFPYPSGDGLHVGHVRPYTGLDIIARKKRLEGFNVLYPMGWDAFGLPTENYAIKNKIHPKIVTEKNIAHFKSQLQSLGFSFDWSREVNTTDPGYYKWTQFIFLKLFEKGLAYKLEMPINFCVECKVGLANEEVVNGVCERCGGEVVKKLKSQWMLKITEYAERLINDLDKVDYIDTIKTQQINWIGRSEGAEIEFQLLISGELDKKSNKKSISIKVFTTRPDTIFGVTFLALSPESSIIQDFQKYIINYDEVQKYQKESAQNSSDFSCTQEIKDKTGVKVNGITAVHPITNKKIPIWIADYVINYGTGAIMAVPGHDSRDWEFAKKFNIDVIKVISDESNKLGNCCNDQVYDGLDGTLINSEFLDGISVKEATDVILNWLEDKKIGNKKINYKLRDWVFSRQRYWGEPIPLVDCKKCGWVPISDLPLVLPEIKDYLPSENGESPLSRISDWVKTNCPKCGGPSLRETDTMPQWAGSSWYFLRYIDPNNSKELANREKMEYWTEVDWYNGGNEHTTLHLLYSRFWYKFLYDIGIVPGPEPYKKRTCHGMILGENNEKMSKSRGNVVNPDDIVEEFGGDTLRLYEMFVGPFDQSVSWSQEGVNGARRFLERVWNLQDIISENGPDYDKNKDKNKDKTNKLVHKTIKKVTEDFEKTKFNTAIAALMSLTNHFYGDKYVTKENIKVLLILLNPVVPHITEEIYSRLDFDNKIYQEKWPKYDENQVVDDEMTIAIQVNGKFRTTMVVSANSDQDCIRNLATENLVVLRHIDKKEIRNIIYVPGKLLNIIT